MTILDFEAYIRAGSSEITGDEFAELSRHECFRVRMRVAENPACAEDILARLAADPSIDVRIAVSENPAASEILLRQMAKDSSADLRYAMASNPCLPLEILESFIKDDNPFVVQRAEASLRRINPASVEYVCFQEGLNKARNVKRI